MLKSVKEVKPALPEQALADVTPPEAYVTARPNLWSGYPSWHHFYRRHRDALFAAGACIEVGGRVLVVASKFDAAVLQLASKPRKTQTRAA